MNSNLVPLSFEGAAVRVHVDHAGQPWFVAADVLSALMLDRKALERLGVDEKGVTSIHTLGGNQEMTVVNEPGLYSLVLGSRKPEAKRFKRWVTSEVLPSIRQTGSYLSAVAAAPYFEIPQTYSGALRLAADQMRARRSCRGPCRRAGAEGGVRRPLRRRRRREGRP